MAFEVSIETAAAQIAAQLPKGIFLSVGGADPNVMTIGWGGLAYYWQKHIFVAPIRPQRHTHPLLLREKAFTLSVPAPGNLGRALAQAGTLSGRDGDKFAAIGLEKIPARTIDAPAISGCGLYVECRVLAQNAFTAGGTDAGIIAYTYQTGDFHGLFYGEITACYAGDAL